MRAQVVLLLTIVVSVALMGMMTVMKSEQLKEEKRDRYQAIKLRVVNKVLKEFQKENIEAEHQLVRAQEEHKSMEEQANTQTAKAEQAKGNLDICMGEMKYGTDQLGIVEVELRKLKAEIEKESSSWKEEEAALTLQKQERSPVCNYLKENADAIRSLCGGKDPKKEDVKKEETDKEEAKKEEGKADESKKEEEKKEESKKEEEKKEEAKKEEEKAEEHKKEEAKAEEPK